MNCKKKHRSTFKTCVNTIINNKTYVNTITNNKTYVSKAESKLHTYIFNTGCSFGLWTKFKCTPPFYRFNFN